MNVTHFIVQNKIKKGLLWVLIFIFFFSGSGEQVPCARILHFSCIVFIWHEHDGNKWSYIIQWEITSYTDIKFIMSTKEAMCIACNFSSPWLVWRFLALQGNLLLLFIFFFNTLCVCLRSFSLFPSFSFSLFLSFPFTFPSHSPFSSPSPFPFSFFPSFHSFFFHLLLFLHVLSSNFI